MSDAPPDERPDRLSGWKEISAYLSKSVRSAQRWEAELDLPIERLTGPEGGQIVQASRREIDEWRQSRMRGTVLDGDADDDPSETSSEDAGVVDAVVEDGAPLADAAPTPLATVSDAAPGTRPPARMLWLVSVALLAGLAAGTIATLATIRVVGAPSRFEVHGTRIQALTEDGYPVWSHTLDRVGARPISGYGVGGREGDLDGDGEFEAAVPITFANPWMTTAEESDEVRIFTRSGSLRAIIRPQATLMQYGRPYSGPWLFTDMAFSTSGPGRLWIAYNGVTGHPSLVIEVDRGGASKVRFVNQGTIGPLAQWPVDGRDRLVVGGSDAASNRAMIASIDLGESPTSWPAEPVASVCAACRWESPVAVALLPPNELMAVLSRPNADVWRLRIAARQIIAEAELGVHRGAMYWFESNLAVTNHRWLPQYQAAHRDLEIQGRVDHPFERCPDATAPMTVRWWRRGSGWTAQQVRTTPSSQAN